MYSRCSQNAPKMLSRCSKVLPRCIQSWFWHPKLTQTDHKVLPRCSQGAPKMLPRRCLLSICWARCVHDPLTVSNMPQNYPGVLPFCSQVLQDVLQTSPKLILASKNASKMITKWDPKHWKSIHRDFTKTCFSCRRQLSFQDSEAAESIKNGSKINPKSHQHFDWKSMHPRWSQNAPKMLSRCSKVLPRWSQDASKPHFGTQNCTKMFPRCFQDAPKKLPRRPRCIRNWVQMLSRCVHGIQHAPRLSRGAPKMLPRPPRCSQNASKADFGTPNCPNMVPKQLYNDTKMTSKSQQQTLFLVNLFC